MAELKIELIAPFVDATREAFSTFIGMKIRRKKLYIKHGYDMFGDISAIIGLSGKSAGTCAISLSAEAAITAVEKMLHEQLPLGMEAPEVRDGVGELVNMIAGQAKAALSTTPYKFDITLPTIISGKGHEFYQKRGTYCVVIMFETEDGHPFTLDVSVAPR